MNHQTVGVVVGRFQVEGLHAGHMHLLQFVAQRHKRLLICVGVAPKRTRHDPLDYLSRARMLRAAYPDAVVVPLLDMPGDDHAWSNELDRTIRNLFPGVKPVLYGARGSFLPHYHGVYETRLVDGGPEISGTERRAALAAETRDSEDFRAGQIHALGNQATPWVACVDVAILKPGFVLLGQKHHEMRGDLYRFVGGMVDDTDPSLEAAAAREAAEETGMEIDALRFVRTFISDDLRSGPDQKWITTLFTARYVFGSPFKPGDDIAVLGWVPLIKLRERLIPTHLPLGVALLETLGEADLGPSCSPLCTGFQHHQPGCPEFREGVYIDVSHKGTV